MWNIPRTAAALLAAALWGASFSGACAAGSLEPEETAAEEVPEREELTEGYYALALEAIGGEDYGLARKYLDMTGMYCPREENALLYADVLLKRACLDILDGDLGIALEQLDEAESYCPELAQIYLVKAQIFSAAQSYAEGARALEAYISLTGEEEQNETLALLYQAAGDAGEALRAYEAYARTGLPDRHSAAFQRAVYQMDAGLWDEAEEVFCSFLGDEAYGLAARFNIAVIKLREGKYQEAKEAFDAVTAAGGYCEGLFYNRGLACMLLGDYPAAGRDFALSVIRGEYVPDSTFHQGVCLVEEGDYGRALELFTSLIDSGIGDIPVGTQLYRSACREKLERAEAE